MKCLNLFCSSRQKLVTFKVIKKNFVASGYDDIKQIMFLRANLIIHLRTMDRVCGILAVLPFSASCMGMMVQYSSGDKWTWYEQSKAKVQIYKFQDADYCILFVNLHSATYRRSCSGVLSVWEALGKRWDLIEMLKFWWNKTQGLESSVSGYLNTFHCFSG